MEAVLSPLKFHWQAVSPTCAFATCVSLIVSLTNTYHKAREYYIILGFTI